MVEAMQETKQVTTDFEVLRILIDLREHVLQKNRIALGNRKSAIERGADEVNENTYRIINRFFNSFEQLESEVDDEIKKLVKELPIVQAMTNVKGIGFMLAARVVSMIDITLVDHVSALWKWAGYSVVDGVADRPRKGESISYNPRLKKAVYLVGESFLKSRSPYRDVYDKWKEEYAARNELAEPDEKRTPKHIHNMAMRKMVKLWLSHLWQVWREMEGLPIVDAYVHQHMKHTTRIEPHEMGW